MRHDMLAPKPDVNDETVVLADYRFHSGDAVRAGYVVMSCEATKTVVDIASEAEGFLQYLFDEGDTAPVNAPVACVFSTREEWAVFAAAVSIKKSGATHGGSTTGHATAKALALAAMHGVDISAIKKEGVIKESDVRAFLARGAKPGTADSPAAARAATPQPARAFKYDRERLLIVGAGKGAEVVIDLVLDAGDKDVVLLVDDAKKTFSAYGRDYQVSEYGVFDFAEKADRGAFDAAVISISANLAAMRLRDKIFRHYAECGVPFANVIAKSALIKRGVALGLGNIVGDNVYIGTGTAIGHNNFFSYAAVIGHHNHIGDCNLFAPAVATSGSVTVGSHCVFPVGVTFLNRITVGNGAVVPLGYAVSRNLPEGTVIRERMVKGATDAR